APSRQPGEVTPNLAHGRVFRALDRHEAEPFREPQHPPVRGEDVTLHLHESVLAGTLHQQLEESPGQTNSVPLIGHGDREFAILAPGFRRIAGPSDDRLFGAFAGYRDQLQLPADPRMRRDLQQLGGKLAQDAHEAKVARLLGEAAYGRLESLPVVRPDGAN